MFHVERLRSKRMKLQIYGLLLQFPSCALTHSPSLSFSLSNRAVSIEPACCPIRCFASTTYTFIHLLLIFNKRVNTFRFYCSFAVSVLLWYGWFSDQTLFSPFLYSTLQFYGALLFRLFSTQHNLWCSHWISVEMLNKNRWLDYLLYALTERWQFIKTKKREHLTVCLKAKRKNKNVLYR